MPASSRARTERGQVDGTERGGARRSEAREYILRSRNRNATVATKLQTISSSHRSSRKSLVGRTSMNQRGLLSIGRIWSSLDLPRSADRGGESGRTLFAGFRSGDEDETEGNENETEGGRESSAGSVATQKLIETFLRLVVDTRVDAPNIVGPEETRLHDARRRKRPVRGSSCKFGNRIAKSRTCPSLRLSRSFANIPVCVLRCCCSGRDEYASRMRGDERATCSRFPPSHTTVL